MMSFGEFARHRGVSRPRVSALVSRGRLDGALVRQGKATLIDSEAADALLGPPTRNGVETGSTERLSAAVSGSIPRRQLSRHSEAQARLAETRAELLALEL